MILLTTINMFRSKLCVFEPNEENFEPMNILFFNQQQFLYPVNIFLLRVHQIFESMNALYQTREHFLNHMNIFWNI
jgi:hypothetical protein